MLPLLVLFGTLAGAWYLLIVRPQKDQQTRHGRLVERLQVGDHVLTVGGIYGRVTALDGAGVVLELAPGLTSRIATDGIARIVHDAEAALPEPHTVSAAPAAPAHVNPPATEQVMQHQQHPHQHQQHPQPGVAPHHVVQQPPMPQHVHAPVPYGQPVHAQPVQYAQPTPVPASAQVAPPPPPQQHHPHEPQHATTLRAQVVPNIPTFQPRPWQDVAPVQQAPQAQYVAPTLPPPPAIVAPPMQVHAPFAQHTAPPAATYAAAPAPSHHVQQPPVQSMPPQQVQPVQYAVPVQQQLAHPVTAPPALAAQEHTRRHSGAPKGMGSSLRLDDPSLRDTMSRARQERAGLAQEYERATAALVDLTPDPVVQHMPVSVGHAPQPELFVHGTPATQQYPAPVRPPAAGHGMPRPGVAPPPPDQIDPALQGAFQRRTPLTAPAAPAAMPAAVGVGDHAGAHAHAHSH